MNEELASILLIATLFSWVVVAGYIIWIWCNIID